MSHRYYARLRRYAILSAFQPVAALVAVAAVAVAPVGGIAPLVLIAFLPLFWAIGAFQAEIAMNERLDDVDRRRWRVLVACVPGAMGLYFHRYLRQP